MAALIGQLPGGMLVDHVHRKRIAAAGALIALGVSALLLCLAPTEPLVWGAEIGHALASCVMTPAIAALTLSFAAMTTFSERLGQNARYASLGNAASAALLGVVASYDLRTGGVPGDRGAGGAGAGRPLLMIRMTDCVDPQGDHPALQHPQRAGALALADFRRTGAACVRRRLSCCSNSPTPPCCRWR